MPSLLAEYDGIVRALDAAYGRPDPGDRPGVVGFRDLLIAFLDQQRGARSAAIVEELDRAEMADEPESLAGAEAGELADLLRGGGGSLPAGLVAALQRLAGWVAEQGGMEALTAAATETLREELRAIRGIGPGTADRLLLDVFDRPTFPIGRSDYRVLIRHGWIDPTADYDEAREAVEHAAPHDPAALRQLASWFERLAVPCRVGKPRCDRCPLQPFLPEGGPLDPS